MKLKKLRPTKKSWAGLAVLVGLALVAVIAYSKSDLSPDQFETNAATLDKPAKTIEGVVIESSDYALTGGLVLHLKTAEGKTVRMVLNRHTTCHWPESWGQAGVLENTDRPDVLVPDKGISSGMKGLQLSAQVKTASFGLFKRRDFAVDVTFRD